MTDSFDDFVDTEGLGRVERERLRHVHELLAAAGQPPDLPAGLETLPAGVTEARVVRFPQSRRRIAAGLVLAAALAVAAFGGGYLVGHHGGGSTDVVRVAAMSGSNAVASIRVGAPDSAGNWPVDFAVRGLPKQTGKYAYYEVFVMRKGKPGYPCGGFRVLNGTTRLRFWVPYEVKASTTWVVTAIDKADRWPGRTVMTMA